MSDLPDPAPDHLAAYAPLTAYAAPARGRAEVWRIFAVLMLLVFLWEITQGLIDEGLRLAWGPILGTMARADLALGITPLGVVGKLLTALPLGLVFLAAVGLVTGRGLGSLVGDRKRLARDFLAAFLPLAALGLGLLPLLAQDPDVAASGGVGRLVAWLPLALPALILTALANELIFRGFLQQQLAARWQASWVWMGLPAALFALLQGAPAAVGDLAPLSLAWGICFSVATADLTARTGSLGAAVGLTTGIMGASLFLVGLRGEMNGLALYVLDARGMALLPWMAADFLTLLVGWMAARILLRV